MNNNISFATASKDYQKGQYMRSLEALNQLIDTQKDVKTYVLLAKNFIKLGFKSEAAAAYALAGKLDSQPQSQYFREAAILHHEAGNEEEALLLGLRMLQRAQQDADLAYVLGSIYVKQGRKDLISPFRKVLSESSNPDHIRLTVRLLSDEVADMTNATLAHNLQKRFPELVALRLLSLIFSREVCDFETVAKNHAPIKDMIGKGDLRFLERDNPFFNLHWTGDEKINTLAGLETSVPLQALAANRRAHPHTWGKKIRIGYLSSDLWAGHATMKLLQRILELHDRDRFEITLFCHTNLEHLESSTVDRSGWGNICIVRDMSNEEAAAAIREREIDILIDLKGHTSGGRAPILNYNTAPIQATWLGFPGSVTNTDLDYTIGDRFVLPESSKHYYHEKFLRMPDVYQPNDPANRPRPRPVTRAQLDLPEDAFVLASFNGNRKITADMMESWCNIMKRAPNTVLWLMLSAPGAQANLQNFMHKRGIMANRIVFTKRIEYQDHMDRLQAADLGIDTFPVNGHTTTSEQLWGGLPVLTVKGTNFASRVSESLLNAIGLPELVADGIKAYEDMAVELAQHPERVAEYKKRIKANAPVMPLFDAERFCRHLETGYEMMVDRAKQGLGPEHMDIPALPSRTTPMFTVDW